MSQHNKERHAAAMLVHQIGSGIEALDDMSPNIAIENILDLMESFAALGKFLLRISEIKEAKDAMYRNHQ